MRAELSLLNPKIIDLSEANFHEIVLHSAKPFMVEIMADWCGECLLMSPILKYCVQHFDGRVNFGKVNIDMNEQLACEYGITELPFLLFFNKGELVDFHIGLASRKIIIAKLEKLFSH